MTTHPLSVDATGMHLSLQPTSSITTPSTTAATASLIPAPTSAPTIGAEDTADAPAPLANTAASTSQPTALTGSIAPKRPAASDPQLIAGPSATSSKRQAIGTGANPFPYTGRPIPNPGQQTHIGPSQAQYFYRPIPTMMPTPGLLTEDQLHGRTPEQLIATILQLQAQHQQFVAQINVQYEHINKQLDDLRGSLIASHHAAASALTPRDQSMRSVIPPPVTLPQQTAIPPPPLPSSRTPTRTAQRDPRAAPASPSRHLVPRASVSTSTPATAVPPVYDYRTLSTVEEVWKEYREGMDGQPAIEQLDATWGSRWRPEPRGRTWYSRRKVIWDKIREFTAEGMDESAAVQEVEKLRDGGTINKLIRMLQDERKEKGLGDDSTLG
ncbi:transcriptional activator of glycolytic enzymes-domain-containing protein [Xylaria sp. CBS 124048]|nr:transcriptional activator of glycolytic enzymes-domain-containing protein [Xylaria sp. CBS 124048]